MEKRWKWGWWRLKANCKSTKNCKLSEIEKQIK